MPYSRKLSAQNPNRTGHSAPGELSSVPCDCWFSHSVGRHNAQLPGRLKRAISLCLCILLLVSVLGVTAQAANSGKKVRVGWFESPFNQTDQFGRRFGYSYEYQQKIAAYAGWEYEYVEGSWPELMELLKKGEIDLLSDVSYTEERAESLNFASFPMGTEEYYVFAAVGNTEIVPDDTASLNGKTVGVNKGSVQANFFQHWAKEHDVHVKLVELTGSEEESMKMLREGTLDAYITLDAFGGHDVSVPVWKIGASDFFFAVSKQREDLLEELNAAMSKIQDENRYYNVHLYEKYLVSLGANVFLGGKEQDWLAKHGPIQVAYQDNYLAFCDEQDGRLTGALKDYLNLASDCLKNAHLDFEPVAYPSVEAALNAVKNGEADCMFPANLRDTDGEELGLTLTPGLMRSEIYTVVREEYKTRFLNKKEIQVAVWQGNSNYDALLKDNFPDWKTVEYPDADACFQAIAAGEADCLLISNYRYNNLSAQCEKLHLTTLATGVTMNYSFAVRKDNMELYSILAKTTGLISDSAVNAALTHYYSEGATVSVSDFIQSNPALVIAVTVVFLALVGMNIAVLRALRATKSAKEKEQQVKKLNEQVFVDALTHVRNKGAYAQFEEKINAVIQKGQQEPFAVVVCDVNNLKTVNDLYGHKAGDACIKNACATICRVFSHSPVFRIGGDEFAILLLGEDYYRRKGLMEQINALPRDRSKIKIGETIAAGLAEYEPKKHETVLSVFEDADKAMYERKQFMKESMLPEDDKTDSSADTELLPVIHARKSILIADDIEMNRELMGDLLQEDYDVLYAADGVETLEILRSHKGEIDLVLLDLQMPNMDGREVIAEMQVDEDLMSVPVVVFTVDQVAELDCLRIGAMDFIPKPYPDIEIVKARIAKCIELAEDRDLIQYTEHDKLTGLLNKEYFYRYVSRLDHLYKGTTLDAVVCDVNRFHTVNKQYGRQFGDFVLRTIGVSMKKLARNTGGIICREVGDTFLLYCPHQDDYDQLFREFLSDLYTEKEIAEKVRLRFGVFPDAKQKTDVEERFDCAKIAADRPKNDPQAVFGFYDLN